MMLPPSLLKVYQYEIHVELKIDTTRHGSEWNQGIEARAKRQAWKTSP
jgi:hypothetical protein